MSDTTPRTETPRIDPLVGLWFVKSEYSWSPPHGINVLCRGQVIDRVGPDHYLARTLDDPAGRPGCLELLALDDLRFSRLYESPDAMSRHADAIAAARRAAQAAETCLGCGHVCGDHACRVQARRDAITEIVQRRTPDAVIAAVLGKRLHWDNEDPDDPPASYYGDVLDRAGDRVLVQFYKRDTEEPWGEPARVKLGELFHTVVTVADADGGRKPLTELLGEPALPDLDR